MYSLLCNYIHILPVSDFIFFSVVYIQCYVFVTYLQNKISHYKIISLTLQSLDRLQISRIQDVSLVPHVPHPLSVIEITLSMACFEQGTVVYFVKKCTHSTPARKKKNT